MSEEQASRPGLAAYRAWSRNPMRRISIYRILISHRYIRSEEYLRLVRMLDQATKRDSQWRWKNCSVSQEAPIMTESAERTRILELLEVNAGRIARTAEALGMSKDTLKQKMLTYVSR